MFERWLTWLKCGFVVPAPFKTIWRCAGIVVCAHPATYLGARCGFGQGYSFEGDPRAGRERNRSSAKVFAELWRTRRSGNFFRKRLGHLGHEAFGWLFLNAKNERIAFESLFRDSTDRTRVHAREVLKRGLELNAAALIACHNHPSGNAEPIQADIGLTRLLFDLLE